MANSNNFDLMAIGRHCGVDSCRVLDYLPFKCDFCKNEFCLSHKDTHSCSEKIDKDSTIPVCPLCQQYITKGINGADDNTQVERHIQSGCKDNVFKKRKKNKCSSPNCRQINLIPFNCERCYQSVCVRHRHPGDHQCLHANSNRNPWVKVW
ncbi:AN1-type zinc finger protein 2A-like [Clytia hemisphaerica]|uniref:AN1-type domain-containing protein n=1 Tax=Clytia hemisphaerica TaxID=252671 RepID=A0A7M5XE04_9CNID|eukprot:TCONS_00073798-protein